MKFSLLASLIILLLTALPLTAQDDVPLAVLINYDDEVADNLTDVAFWDWWHIQAGEGDVLVVNMFADEALEPLLGLLSPEGDLLTRSADGVAGGRVTMEYTIPATGEYTIVATRAGNESGTSTGSYQLQVRRANAPDSRAETYQQVTFRCQDYEVTNVATVEFSEDTEQADFYLISIYGFGGFEPVIRVDFDGIDLEDCSRDSQGMAGTVYTVPGEEPVTIEGENPHVAQLMISSADEVQGVTLTIGSANGTTGRYVALIDGFTIGEDDLDTVRIGQGPLAATDPLVVYMVAGSGTRLDPSLRLLTNPADDDGIVCDDAGRRGCEDVPSPVGLSIQIANMEQTITADRFDAGITLSPGPPQLRDIELGSFRGNTTGRYALVLLGSLADDDR